MTWRAAALLVATGILVAACGPHVVAGPHTVPASVQLRLLRLPRVWVAGFVSRGDPGFDLSRETVRLLTQQLRALTPAGVVDAHVVSLADESVFKDHGYWEQLGEEYGHPLIVTGSVRFLIAPAVPVLRGRRTTYVYGTGRVLEATVVVIDGKSGAVLVTKELPRRTRYGIGSLSSPRILYYELMDQTSTDWLAAIANVGSEDVRPRAQGRS